MDVKVPVEPDVVGTAVTMVLRTERNKATFVPRPNGLLVRKEAKEYNTICNNGSGTPFIQHVARLFHTNSSSSRGSPHRQRYFCL